MKIKKNQNEKVIKGFQGKVKLRKEIVFRTIDDEAAIVRPEDGTLMIINETGSFILKNLKRGILIENLIKKVLNEYEVNKERAERDVYSFIKALEKEGIIEIS